MSVYATLERAVDDLRAGRFLVLVDSRERENEGDLIVAAEKLTPEAAAFMMRRARGMFLLSTTPATLARIGVPLIEPRHGDTVLTPRMGVPFDARHDIDTGIAAADRATTVRRAVDPSSGPDDFVLPGHVQPLATHDDGFAARQGHTEGSVALVQLAGLAPAAVMSEVLTHEGRMADRGELETFARQSGCRIVEMEEVARGVG